MKRWLSFIIIFLSGHNLFSQDLIINEFMSSNQNTILDQDGDSSDWIEIYNAGDQVVNLENFKLSDDIDSLDKWLFPNINILPSQFLLIFCSSKNIYDINELHTNFKIKQSGESLFLSNADGIIISSIILYISSGTPGIIKKFDLESL